MAGVKHPGFITKVRSSRPRCAYKAFVGLIPAWQPSGPNRQFFSYTTLEAALRALSGLRC